MPFSERSCWGESPQALPPDTQDMAHFQGSFADGSPPALPRSSSSSSSSPSLPPPPTTEDSSEEADSVDVSGVVPPSFKDLLAMSSSLILI